MAEASRANRTFWDADAARYHAAHPEYLAGFHWSPEMLTEEEAGLLGDVRLQRVLEIGCGSAPCASWVAAQQTEPGFVTGFDLSAGMLGRADGSVPLVQADVLAMPYADDAFDVVFSAFGALPFVRDIDAALREVARVLRPEGRFVFSVTHPMRWVFPDDPALMEAQISYFQREYEEYNEHGELTYAEYHRTFGDWVRALGTAGFWLADVIEPEWPEGLELEFGQWSPARGKLFPGTAIFVAFNVG
ncbi:methyltransferase domain-containing protein [Corynebacterium sp. CNCTC7651]|uniref:methyltransferase domain-containing protein n=1 Tax=Corynebacterium sp. CNCTC7651 TaxID=2815361 RepID=UPI001F1BF9BA|nr:methyltransferase domain-containing protein [Corynebacterium sp. CNCTC7651]UIZ93060.1 methyltransferase domain-containing protein [Corynebacterium sp. CNCTC7651]